MKPRVRFAPSPTGPLHIGGVRTALYNYLFAKNTGGKFILRIEDTDQKRYVNGAEEYINSTLEWLNLLPDEGPIKGGNYGPYRQSERKSIYQEYAQKLIENDLAYYAFDTPQELEKLRENLKTKGSEIRQYNFASRNDMSNSLTLSDEIISENLKGSYVIRLKVPENQEVSFKDLVRGDINFNTSTLDDKVLIKSDGLPTYHLANVVDDHLMKISHVIRGEEWLPSTPTHVLLYQFFGWKNQIPEFAHLPLLLKPEGTGKLSKRDSEKHGFPIFPLNWVDPITQDLSNGFREKGFLPEALINFLALLGWNTSTDQEIFSIQDLIKYFSINKISKSGIKFDILKAKWFNQQYIRKLSNSDLAGILIDQARKEGRSIDINIAELIVDLFRERINLVTELYPKSKFFFQPPSSYDQKVIKKKWTSEIVALLEEVKALIKSLKSNSAEELKLSLENFVAIKNVSIGKLMQPLRVALTGEAGGPDLFQIMIILGSEEIDNRISKAIERNPAKN